MFEVLKYLISLVLILGVSIFTVIFSRKSKLKNIFKIIICTAIYAALTIGTYALKIELGGDASILYGNSIVIISGFLAGGPTGVAIALLGGILRIVSYIFDPSSMVKLSSGIVYLVTGFIVFMLTRVTKHKDNIRWIYGVVSSLIMECLHLLLIYLTNMSDLEGAYVIIRKIYLIDVGANLLIVALSLIVACLLIKQPVFKVEKPLSIRTKVQLNLLIAILIGFTSVIGVAAGVLNKNANDSNYSTAHTACNDTKNNLVGDANIDIKTAFKNSIQDLSMKIIDGNPNLNEDLQDVCSKRHIGALTLIKISDNTIIASSDPYFVELGNFDNYNVQEYDVQTKDYLILDYEYVAQRDAYYKHAFRVLNPNNLVYYVLATFDQDAYQYYLSNSITKGVADRHVGERGYFFVCDNENNILNSSTDEFGTKFEFDLSKKEKLSKTIINNTKYYYYVEDYAGLNLVCLMNKQECDLNKYIATSITAFTSIMVFFVLYCFIYISTSKNVLRPLKRVNESLDDICGGKLDKKVEEYSTKELKVLSEDINSTVDALKEYIGKEAKLIQKELEFAKDIQYSALPKLSDEIKNDNRFTIFASMNAAKEVGGDFYDYYFVDDKHLFILIADVSGKGVPAAMFMMQSKTIVKALIENKIPVADAITLANSKLCESNSAQMFVTMWCALIDLETGDVEYVNAGHNPPLIRQNDGKFEYIVGKHGFVLAGFDGYKYKSQQIKLEKGDELFLYTDGVTEALSVNEELYGEPRLLEFTNSVNDYNSETFCENVLANVKEFAKDKEQSDDITMLHIKFLG